MEYSLVFVFIVVAGLGVTRYLTTVGANEVVNQADCVSRRPPPPSCQVRAAVPTTTTSTPAVTSTTAGPTATSSTTTTSTSTTSTTTPPPATTTFTPVKRTGPNGPAVDATITVRSGTTPVPGAEVRVQFVPTPGGTPFEGTCITNAAGTCALQFDSPYSDTTSITITVLEVTSIPAAGPLPAPQTVTFP